MPMRPYEESCFLDDHCLDAFGGGVAAKLVNGWPMSLMCSRG